LGFILGLWIVNSAASMISLLGARRYFQSYRSLVLMTLSKPDRALLALMMPVMGGFELLDEIRMKPDFRDSPVVVVTARDLDENDRRLLSGRVEQVMDKSAQSQQEVSGSVHKLPADATLAAEVRESKISA
jgi:CheY-like chemotaxis protein